MLVYYFIHYKVYSKFVHSVLRCILKNKHFPAAYEYVYCEAWAHIPDQPTPPAYYVFCIILIFIIICYYVFLCYLFSYL